MIRKILLLTSTVGVLAVAGAATAQDAVPPTAARPTSPVAQATPALQPGDYSPGAAVVASDGADLGVVDRVHVSASGEQMLHVRAPDGAVKAVPTVGATVRDGTVAVAWTEAQFEAAAAAPEPIDEVTPPPTQAPRTPETLPVPPIPEDKPDASDPPVDPPAQPRA